MGNLVPKGAKPLHALPRATNAPEHEVADGR